MKTAIQEVPLKSILEFLQIENIKRNAKGFLACCPNPEHDDKKPSWTIYNIPGQSIHTHHKCMSCGYRGDIFKLLEDIKGFSKEESSAFLKDFQPDVFFIQKAKEQVFFKEFSFPNGVEFKPFGEWHNWPKTYLLKRNIQSYQVQKHRLGYALFGRLQGRIVLPKICPKTNKVVGFTARSFLDNETRKYLEAEDCDSPNRFVFFGENTWKKREKLFLTEGVLNALSIEHACIEHGSFQPEFAAITGSSISPLFIQKIKNFKEVILATDADEAGEKVANHLYLSLQRYVPKLTKIQFEVNRDANDLSSEILYEKILNRHEF